MPRKLTWRSGLRSSRSRHHRRMNLAHKGLFPSGWLSAFTPQVLPPPEHYLSRWLQTRDEHMLCEVFSDGLEEVFGLDQAMFVRQHADGSYHKVIAYRGLSEQDIPTTVVRCPASQSQHGAGSLPDGRVQVLETSRHGQFSACFRAQTRSGNCVVGMVGKSGRAGNDPPDLTQLEQWVTYFELALDNQEHLSRLEELSYTDALTGVFNRRFFQRRLNEEITRARRFDRCLSLVIFDLDRFKVLNDRHGHQAGDQVLQQLAQLLTVSIRSIDIPCRYGGDEFVIVMPETAHPDCFSFTRRLRQTILEHEFQLRPDHRSERLTVSMGAAVFPDHANGPEQLFWCADMALLKAKESGGDTTVIFAPGMEASCQH